MSLLVHTELAESTNEDILTGGKGPFDDFDEGFGDLRRLVPRESDLVRNGLDNVGLGQCHVGAPVCLGVQQEGDRMTVADDNQFVNDSK